MITLVSGRSVMLIPRVINVETTLQWHGVNTKQVVRKLNGRSIGYRILEFIEQTPPNLLVMGAYEHSESRQSIRGSSTSKVLKNPKIPVIASH